VVAKHQRYSPEFREEAARMVVDGSRAIVQVARELGLSETSLGNGWRVPGYACHRRAAVGIVGTGGAPAGIGAAESGTGNGNAFLTRRGSVLLDVVALLRRDHVSRGLSLRRQLTRF
jgi:transposase